MGEFLTFVLYVVFFSYWLYIKYKKIKHYGAIKKLLLGHVLVENIIRNNLPIDIYGRGANLFTNQNVKGEFISNEQYI